ncbi:MAG: triose-phosphate isomerase [Bdellovibrionota bacterium]
MKKILAGNWKLQKNRLDVKNFVEACVASPLLGKLRQTRTIIIPSPVLLESAVLVASETKNLEVFSQNTSMELSGAWTGETSPMQLLDIGVRGTLVGHSERRQHFGDTDATCEKRATLALTQGLDVIYCIGETLEQREANQTQSVLKTQIEAYIRAVKTARAAGTKATAMVAYEPVWAIGTGKVAGPEQVAEAHAWIHRDLEAAGAPAAILYGGSVKPSNFKELAAIPHVAGALVGGASLEAKDYLALLEILDNAP